MRKTHGFLCLLLCLLLAAGGRMGSWSVEPDGSLPEGYRIAAARYAVPHQEGELTTPGFVQGSNQLKTSLPDGAPGTLFAALTAAPATAARTAVPPPCTHAAKAYLVHIHPSHHFW